MPHPGHLCVARDCRFHLNTYVGGYIVSTVGEYWPDSRVREINAKCRGKIIRGIGDEWDINYFKEFGYEEIGYNRKYETMVFKAKKSKNKECCPYDVADLSELDIEGYNTPDDAVKGHMKLCLKWSKKK